MMKLIIASLILGSTALASEPRLSMVDAPVRPFTQELRDLARPDKKIVACVLPGNTCVGEYDLCCSNGDLCQATFPTCP